MTHKEFKSIAGAHKYAENSSRLHEASRYVINRGDNDYYVTDDATGRRMTGIVEAHYFNGERMDAPQPDAAA